MPLKPVLPGILLLLLLAAFATPEAGAWSNGGYSADQANPDYGTHDWIVEQALMIQTKNVSFMTSTFHSRLLLGTEAPDNPAFIGDTGEHHVYYRSTGVLQDNSSAVRASSIYSNALAYLEAGDYQEAAYCVGVMSHYIADVGVFGHTMGSGTDWGAETHHSDYEDHIQSITYSLTPPTGLLLGDSSAYDATLGLAQKTTFGSGQIMANTWMDGHYSWSDATFSASATASLSAAVSAVASSINHLMVEATGSEPLPPGPDASPPTPPTGLAASWVKGSGVVLTWSAPSSGIVTGYSIYRGTNSDRPENMLASVGDTLSWTDGSVTPGETFYYWVAASNSAGASNLSAPTFASVPGHGTSNLVPIIVAGLSVVAAAVGALAIRSSRLKSSKGRSR